MNWNDVLERNLWNLVREVEVSIIWKIACKHN